MNRKQEALDLVCKGCALKDCIANSQNCPACQNRMSLAIDFFNTPLPEGLREKIDGYLHSEMVTIGGTAEEAKTGQMWAYDSERLSKHILSLLRSHGLYTREQVEKEKVEFGLSVQEGAMAMVEQAKKEARERIFSRLETKANQELRASTGIVHIITTPDEWQSLKNKEV